MTGTWPVVSSRGHDALERFRHPRSCSNSIASSCCRLAERVAPLAHRARSALLAGRPGRPASADPACPDSQPTVSPPLSISTNSPRPSPSGSNTCMTTSYGPAWADILVKPENFLQCKGASIALCYYSGPGPVTPCEFAPDNATASCTCYEIPGGPTYFVDINAILNLDVYLATVAVCGIDGSSCQPRGPLPAPVCDSINKNTFIPGADLISTFSLYLEREIRHRPDTVHGPRSLCRMHDGARARGRAPSIRRLTFHSRNARARPSMAPFRRGKPCPRSSAFSTTTWSGPPHMLPAAHSRPHPPVAFPTPPGRQGVRCCHRSHRTFPRHQAT